MLPHHQSRPDAVEQLLRNAQLRDELEPLYDESIGCVDVNRMTTHSENEFLQSMLEWERAPMAPICEWFEPRLTLESPEEVDSGRLPALIAEVTTRLFEKHIVLDFTDHLSDRQLYTLIYRDILPSFEKKIDRRESYLHWDCANTDGDPEAWLRYYANDAERDMWADETGGDLPAKQEPMHRRRLPVAPL